MLFECEDCRTHLRKICPTIINCFYLSLDRCGVIYQSLGDFRRRADLPVHAPIRSAEIMQCPIRNSIVELFLEFAPAGDRPFIRDTAWEKQISIVATRYAF
jgi:hypothetical protein